MHSQNKHSRNLKHAHSKKPGRKFSAHKSGNLPAAEVHKPAGKTVAHPRAFADGELWRETGVAYGLGRERARQLEIIGKRIHDQVCGVSPDFGYDGVCHSLDPTGCVFSRMLPEIVEAVSSVDSAYVKDYADAVRERVCVHCPNRSRSGECDVRDQANCHLDAYLALVVDVIESVLSGKDSSEDS